MPSYSVSVLAPISSVVLLVYFPLNPVASQVLSKLVSVVEVLKTCSSDSFLNYPVILDVRSEVYVQPFFTYYGTSSEVSQSGPSVLVSVYETMAPLSMPTALGSVSPE